MTALHYAAGKGDCVAARLLLDAGGDPSLMDNQGFAPLYTAARFVQVKTFELLLRVRPNVPPPSAHLLELGPAVEAGHVGMVKLLLNAGASPQQNATDDVTILERAVHGFQKDIVKLLLEAWSHQNVRESHRFTW